MLENLQIHDVFSLQQQKLKFDCSILSEFALGQFAILIGLAQKILMAYFYSWDWPGSSLLNRTAAELGTFGIFEHFQ